MQTNLTALALAIGLATLTLTIPAQAAKDCEDKIIAICTTCHYQTRICEKLDKKSKREWQTTLKRMLRFGLVLDEAGQGRVLECLMALKKDHGKFCK